MIASEIVASRRAVDDLRRCSGRGASARTTNDVTGRSSAIERDAFTVDFERGDLVVDRYAAAEESR
jgi:hypothetical protein